MRVSYFVPIIGSNIPIVREILSELGIRNESQLYAVKMIGEENLTLALSIIPPRVWNRTFRLTVYLSRKEGSLWKAAEILSDLNINLIASWAAATTALGEGCWTSVVELPLDLIKKSTFDIQKTITELMNNAGILSESKEFETGINRVYLSQSKILDNLKEFTRRTLYTGYIVKNSMDLLKFRDQKGINLFSTIQREFARRGRQIPTCCLITPDTEERYIRLAFLSNTVHLVQIELHCEIASKKGMFKGYYGAALKALSHLRCVVYSADNFLLAKIDRQNDEEEINIEKPVFVFTVDIARAELSEDPSERENEIFNAMRKYLKEHANNSDGEISFKEPFKVREVDTIYQRCFFATNAKMKEYGIEFARDLILHLRGLRLNPVNVDVTKTKARFPIEDAKLLLEACPMVISLHLPIGGNALIKENATDCVTHCPSDWVLFEEIYALALGKSVFRLRHKKVRAPKYSLGIREFEFDEKDFQEKRDELLHAVKTHQGGEQYIDAVVESEKRAEKIAPEILRRDLDKEYFDFSHDSKIDREKEKD